VKTSHWLICVALILASACTSFATKVDSWVGNPITDRLDLNKSRIEKNSAPDVQGNTIYVEEWDKGCRVFWTVNTAGIIAAWKSEGKACKYYTT